MNAQVTGKESYVCESAIVFLTNVLTFIPESITNLLQGIDSNETTFRDLVRVVLDIHSEYESHMEDYSTQYNVSSNPCFVIFSITSEMNIYKVTVSRDTHSDGWSFKGETFNR